MRSLAMTAVLSVALGGPVAHANGRAPITNGVHFQPGEAKSVYVATTFGLLISHDDGCTFRWICEQNIGYGGTFDPKYRLAADGTIFATTFSGLRVSRDGGCTFTTATADQPVGSDGRIAGIWIDAIDIGPTGEVWVATAESGKPNNIYRSTDNGVTFASRGMLSPSIWWKSIATAATRPQRVYATGYQVAGTAPDGSQMPPTAHFEITDDGGDTWTESALTGVAYGPTPLVYAVGVDHMNPDIVLMNSAGANPPSGDRLYRSIDGGKTWTDVLDTQGAILDVALTQAGIMVATLGGGGYQSPDAGATFAPIAKSPQLACVGQRDDGAIFGCAANWDPDNKAVARTVNGASWDKVFRFSDLSGPVECAAGTAQHDQCASQWSAIQEQFGADGPATCGAAPPEIDAGVAKPTSAGGCCDAGSSSTGGLIGIGAIAALVGLATLRRRGRKKACCS